MTSERKAELRDLTHYYGVEELLNALDAAEQEIESYKAEVKRWKDCAVRIGRQIGFAEGGLVSAMFDETDMLKVIAPQKQSRFYVDVQIDPKTGEPVEMVMRIADDALGTTND